MVCIPLDFLDSSVGGRGEEDYRIVGCVERRVRGDKRISIGCIVVLFCESFVLGWERVLGEYEK